MPDDRRLTDAEYQMVQSQLITFSQLVRDMPLEAFLERLALAEAIGPFMDPTAFRAGAGHLGVIKRMAEGLRTFQRVLPTLDEAKRLDAARDRLLGLAGEGG